jgi:peptidoglycan/xylan/chitin deacetylase (PgdA/CDA1 family)
MHIAINFHYIGMPPTAYPGIHGFSTEGFAEVLAGIAAEWTFISLEEMHAAVVAGKPLPSRSCLITFDDGLRCQSEQALPVLDAMGIPAAFFALASPYRQRRAAAVHKLHFVRAHMGDEFINGMLEDMFAAGRIVDRPANISEAQARDSYRYDDLGSARLKYFLNYRMPQEFTEALVDDLLRLRNIDEADFIRDYYMSPAQIRDIGQRNMVGSHAVSHRPLAQMPLDAAKLELEESRAVVAELSGQDIFAVSYPLGNTAAVNPDVGRLAAETGYTVGWTMERAQNASLEQPLLFARFDAADIKTLNGVGVRSRYLDEAAARR